MSELPSDVAATEAEMQQYVRDWPEKADIEPETINLTFVNSQDIEDFAYILRPLIWQSSKEFREGVDGLRSGDAFTAARINSLINDLMRQLGAIHAKHHPGSPKVFETNDDILEKMSKVDFHGSHRLGQF